MSSYLSFCGRLGLALIFLVSGWGKLAGYAATQQYMESMGVPGALLPLVVSLELLGGLAILAGSLTRWAAVALSLFSLSSAALFHADFADPAQATHFWKNVAIAGGFCVLAANGAGALSVDALVAKRRAIQRKQHRATGTTPS